MMDVILLERVQGLGQMGEIVSVKPGYARNYLLPQGKALRATDENRATFEKRRTQLEGVNLEKRQEAEVVAKKMDGITVNVIRQAAEGGHLYGSVSARDIEVAVTASGFTIERSQVRLNQTIKMLGLYPIEIYLHPEVSVVVTVNVARSEDEAKIQREKGVAVVVKPDNDKQMSEEAPLIQVLDVVEDKEQPTEEKEQPEA